MIRLKKLLFERMSYDQALKIFGLKGNHGLTHQELKNLWKKLSKQNHPDFGGTHVAMRDINAAWDVLKGTQAYTNYKDEFESNRERAKRLSYIMRDEIVKGFDEKAFLKHFKNIFGQSFKFIAKKITPKDSDKDNKYANFSPEYTVRFVSADEEVYFNISIWAQTYRIASKGLGSGDISFQLYVSSDGFFNNRKQKLFQQNWKWTSDHKVLRNPELTFPRKKLEKKKSLGKSKSFKKRDMMLFAQNKLDAMWDSQDFVWIPVEEDLDGHTFVIYRSVFQRIPVWTVHGLYGPKGKFIRKRVDLLTITSFPETEETANFLLGLQKKARRKSGASALIKLLNSELIRYRKSKEKK